MKFTVKPFSALTLDKALLESEKYLNSGIDTEIILYPGKYSQGIPGLIFSGPGLDASLKIGGLPGKGDETLITGFSELERYGWRDLGNNLFCRNYENNLGTYGDPWFPVKDRIGRKCEQLFVDDTPYIPVSVEIWETSGFWNVETPEAERAEIREKYIGYNDPAASLDPGEFTITEGPDLGLKLFIRFRGDATPYSSKMEITSRGTILDLGPKNNLILENLTFTGSGSFPRIGMMSGAKLSGPGRNWKIRNCSFLWNSALGLSISSVSDLEIKGCHFSFNGYGGLGLDDINRFSLVDCSFEGNDWRNFLGGAIHQSHCTAGVKIHKSEHGVIHNCRAVRNGINGIWLDIQCGRIHVEDCLCQENRREGLFFEFSQGPFTAVNNFLIRNGEHDYIVDAVGISKAEGNTIVHSGSAGAVCFGQGMRYNDHTGPAQKPGQSHIFSGNTIRAEKTGSELLGLFNRVYPYQQTPDDEAAYSRFPECMNVENNVFFADRNSLIIYEDLRTDEKIKRSPDQPADLPGTWKGNICFPPGEISLRENNTRTDRGWVFWSRIEAKGIYD